MRVDGFTQVHGPQGIRPPHHLHAPDRSPAGEPASAAGPVDKLEISPAAQEAIQAAEATEAATGTAEVRHDLVARIRQQIAQGSYETPEKLSRALDGLLDEIG